MEITKEMLQKKADAVKTNMDGFLQGYMSALADLAKDVENAEKKEEVKA
jgi:hypothetical protein